MTNRQQALALYRALMREANKFSAYNYREYALTKIKHEFRSKRNETNQTAIASLTEKARTNLDILRRQTLIGSMYHQSGLVIENWLDQQRHPPGQSANSSSTSSTPLR